MVSKQEYSLIISSALYFGKNFFRQGASIFSIFHCPVLLPYNGLLRSKVYFSIMLMLEPHKISIISENFNFESHLSCNIEIISGNLSAKNGNSSKTRTILPL